MPNDKNKQLVQDLRAKIAKAKAMVFTDYIGLKANDINALRDSMRQNDAEVTIAKNTLLKIALKEEKVISTDVEKDLEGPTAVIFAYKDGVSPLKPLYEFIKKLELPKVKSALFDGNYSTAAEVEIISALPSREQLLAQVVGGLKSPLSGIVGVLNGVQRKFVYAVSAIAKKKEVQ